VLVLDSSAALEAAQFRGGMRRFGRERLVAPPLMWSESRSVVHEAVWRGKTSNAQAEAVLSQLVGGRIEVRTHRRLGARAWEIADELGWAKTYDAEYVALASLLGCRLVTVDGRLRRGAARLGFVIGPDEL
jgi:predicted nucleic acid-binding protein